MNERILELADKAVEDMPSGPWNIPDEFCKKFAELLVRECTSICAKQAWESRTNDDWTEYNALSRVAGQIKQHFGVES